MRLTDLIDQKDMKRALDEKLVNVRQHHDGTLIYNYADAALWTPGAWDNPAVRQCRGLIVRDGEVIARPWVKFFNYGQAEAAQIDLDEPVEVTDKYDGSLGILYQRRDGSLAIATRGSFESEQAKHATIRLQDYLDDSGMRAALSHRIRMAMRHTTFLFEIVYPDNRIVLDYGKADELVLLGAVDIKTGRTWGPTFADAVALAAWSELGVKRAVRLRQHVTLAEALSAPPRPNAEGLVVRAAVGPEQRMVKIKQEGYIALHRIVTGLSERVVWQHMSDEKTLGGLLSPLPDELHEWAREAWCDLLGETAHIEILALDTYENILNSLETDYPMRADFAAEAKKTPELAKYLFLLYDGRDVWPAILKSLKPKGDTRAFARTEDTA